MKIASPAPHKAKRDRLDAGSGARRGTATPARPTRSASCRPGSPPARLRSQVARTRSTRQKPAILSSEATKTCAQALRRRNPKTAARGETHQIAASARRQADVAARMLNGGISSSAIFISGQVDAPDQAQHHQHQLGLRRRRRSASQAWVARDLSRRLRPGAEVPIDDLRAGPEQHVWLLADDLDRRGGNISADAARP